MSDDLDDLQGKHCSTEISIIRENKQKDFD